jgi:hypothetical protein
MTKKDETNRRDFLKLAGTAAPVAAVMTAAGTATAEPALADLSSEVMQDTAHTRAYIESTKF